MKILDSMKQFYNRDECTKYYELGKNLGTGSFATVKSATCTRDSSEWAIKCINKKNLGATDREALQVEVEVMELIDHKNIVKLREVFDTRKVFYMVMENMKGGELFDRIVEKEKYNETEARGVVRDLCQAIAYCHELGVVHRDLKPENLLYDSTEEGATIKIADFGLAKLRQDDKVTMSTACGTPGYVAPEIISGLGYDASVDLWSMGVIMYILLCGFPPFYDENDATLFSTIKSGEFDYPSPYWDNVSSNAKDLINKMLVVDPFHRISAASALRHPWFLEGEQLDDTPLPHFKGEMSKFNARRRFQRKVRQIKMVNTFARAPSKDAQQEDAEAEEIK